LSSNKLEFTLIGIYQTQIFPVPIIIFTEKKKKKKERIPNNLNYAPGVWEFESKEEILGYRAEL
jgi:hypothetical protein